MILQAKNNPAMLYNNNNALFIALPTSTAMFLAGVLV